jgi:uncharacterized protein YpmS
MEIFMKKNTIHKLFLVLIAIPVLISIACNIPFVQMPVSDESGETPITTLVIEKNFEGIEESADQMEDSVDLLDESKPFHLTVTEAQLTSIINAELQSYQEYKIDNVKVFLREGKVKISGNAEQNNLVLPVTIVVIFKVGENGIPEYEIVSANVGPFQLPDFIIEQLDKVIENALNSNIMPAADDVFIEDLVIEDGQATISGYTK